jgi:hypothetical protein
MTGGDLDCYFLKFYYFIFYTRPSLFRMAVHGKSEVPGRGHGQKEDITMCENVGLKTLQDSYNGDVIKGIPTDHGDDGWSPVEEKTPGPKS